MSNVATLMFLQLKMCIKSRFLAVMLGITFVKCLIVKQTCDPNLTREGRISHLRFVFPTPRLPATYENSLAVIKH